ncbi:hypothetical protein E2C01_029043 [Portunus trituberculatus]|uniref:Uncharacterized protein n=1 Tax=Portunus trituberculatus TaxID=210409 RepID=A0A5B7EQX9_PORTR|nr:hypothetical protein [Portunus trituberculatus]
MTQMRPLSSQALILELPPSTSFPAFLKACLFLIIKMDVRTDASPTRPPTVSSPLSPRFDPPHPIFASAITTIITATDGGTKLHSCTSAGVVRVRPTAIRVTLRPRGDLCKAGEGLLVPLSGGQDRDFTAPQN